MANAKNFKIPDGNGNLVTYPLIDATNKRTRTNITSNLTNLEAAIAEQNLEKYGYSTGDYFVGPSSYTYILGDLDTYYGGYNNQAVVNIHHIGIVVNTHATHTWGSTTENGYNGSDLQAYLEADVMNNIKSDMIALFGGSTGLEHLVSHSKLFTTNNSTGWAWQTGKYISALSEVQVYGSTIFSMNGYQEGDTCRQLDVFRKFRFNEILGNIWIWLKNLMSASYACCADGAGNAAYYAVSNARRVVGLILFH